MANVIRLPTAQRRSGRRRTVPLSGMPRAEVFRIRRERPSRATKAVIPALPIYSADSEKLGRVRFEVAPFRV
jgi:hypothetical protein